jgi:hypothetical protein
MNGEIPTRADVEAKLLDLIEGRASREEVSSWAQYWLHEDFEKGRDLFDDPVLLDALEALSGADLGGFERPYLHYEEDFRAWLDELRQG